MSDLTAKESSAYLQDVKCAAWSQARMEYQNYCIYVVGCWVETLSIERLEANVCFFISASRNGDST
jgi:hypothetical protein